MFTCVLFIYFIIISILFSVTNHYVMCYLLYFIYICTFILTCENDFILYYNK